jgi:hypothetical protein
MASRVEGSAFIEILGAGHLIPVEVPEAFFVAVMPFLEEGQ